MGTTTVTDQFLQEILFPEVSTAYDSSAHDQHPQRDITLQQSWRLYCKMKMRWRLLTVIAQLQLLVADFHRPWI